MSHTAVRRVAVASFALNLFCLMTAILIASVLRPPYCTPVDTAPVIPTSIAEEIEKIQLPMKIECTFLTVQTMAVYDGPFYEDGSGREVMDVAAVIVYNGSNTVIPYSYIQIDTVNTRFVFHAHMLPPQSFTLVPEAAAQPYSSEKICNVFAWHTVQQEQENTLVLISEQDDITLKIENQSGCDIFDLTIYFKQFTDGIYIGGKPFEYTIASLEKGSAVTVSPPYYVSGCSRIISYKETRIPSESTVAG